MTATLIVSAALVPLVLAWLVAGRHGHWLSAVAAFPAIAAAFVVPSSEVVAFEWLLLGIQLGLDDTGRLFLLASAFVWAVSAVYAAASLRDSPDVPRFRVFFLLAMTGNFTLILAQDMATFFLGFTLMGLSAYGLVAHRRSTSVRRAGRLYLGWTILGEVVLFSALVMLAAQSGGLAFDGLRTAAPSPVAVALVVIGFGIKLALPGLHVWLPATYAAAPAAGAAVLSGPMISAGLLGWMRFLPPGNDALVSWGTPLIAVGTLGAVIGVGVGLLQRNPKVVLGYSSISKMGALTAGFGIALAHPNAVSLLVPALILYAVHHLLVKSALFIGIDLVQSVKANVWTVAGLTVLGLALAGAPLTSGALAKYTWTSRLPESAIWFGPWLSIAALGTTLLLGRLCYLLSRTPASRTAINRYALTAWFALVMVVIATPLILGSPQALYSGGMPVALGAVVTLLVWRYPTAWLGALIGQVPPGDVLHLMRRAALLVGRAVLQWNRGPMGQAIRRGRDRLRQAIDSAIRRALQSPAATSPARPDRHEVNNRSEFCPPSITAIR